MSLQPVLLVGVGGSGSKALRTLRQTLLRRLRSAGWERNDLPDAWQMVALDTVTVADADGYPEPLLPGSQYLGMVPPAMNYGSIVSNLVRRVPANRRQSAFGGWLPENIPVQVAFGAGQNRAVGRAVAAFALGDARKKLNDAYLMCRQPGALAELTEVSQLLAGDGANISPETTAFVITSVAGGTGSGMFLDVVEVLSAIEPNLGKRAQVILFGPDVFGPLLSGGGGGGIAANTLAAISSVTGGVWHETASEGTEALYQVSGMAGNASGAGLIPNAAGSRYNFVLGAVNSLGTPVGTLDAAYRAAGDSLAAIIADPQVLTDFRNFFRINTFENSWMPNLVGDESGLKPHEPKYTLPFASFGSAKVSLGTQRFAEYAAQALAKTAIIQLLWPTLSPDDPSDSRNDSTKISEATEDLWATFLERSGLDERADHDDVVNALLSPEVEQRSFSLASALVNKAAVGAQANGGAPVIWVRNLQALWDAELQKFLDDTTAYRAALARDWVDVRQGELLSLVTQAATRSGLEVAAALIQKLRTETVEVATKELPSEANSARRTLDELPGKLSAILTGANLNSVPANHPLISEVQSILAKAARFREMAERYETASHLMMDIEENFLKPLEKALRNARTELLVRTNNKTLDDGRPNTFDDHPALETTPGQAFKPGPTELLLIDPTNYPDLLETHTRRSLNAEDQVDWRNRLLQAVVSGIGLSEETLDEPYLKVRNPWTTRVREARRQTAGLPAPAEFNAVIQPEEFIERALRIVSDPNTSLGRFTTQSLRDFLFPADPAEKHSRQSAFVAKLTQAFNVGAPLAQVNDTLAMELHPSLGKSATGYLTVISSIPIPATDPLYEQLQSALTTGKHWDPQRSPSWFRNTTASEINIFQASRSAMSAMAITSLMDPVNTTWQKLRNDPAARAGFWKMKRARPLVETLPVAPEVLDAMVEGWFIAGLLGLRQDDRPDSKLGHRSQIWDIEERTWQAFPYPMLGTDGGGMNQLPGVLISILLAMAECNHQSNLRPLAPYRRLIGLGQHFREDASDDPITQWVTSGIVPPGAPTPDPRRAGTASESLDERREALIRSLDTSLETFQKHFAKIEETQDPFATDLAWELRDLIHNAHRELRRRVSEIVDEDRIL